MTKLLGIYNDWSEAQTALARLHAAGLAAPGLTLMGGAPATSAARKKPWLIGGTAGLAASFLWPGGGHVLLAGHLARTAVWHTLGVATTHCAR